MPICRCEYIFQRHLSIPDGCCCFLLKHSGTSELRNLYSCLSQFCKWQKGRYAVTIQKKYRKHKESSVSILYGYWLFIYPKSHKTKRRNEKMFTNDYFTKDNGLCHRRRIPWQQGKCNEVPDGFRFHGETGSGELSRASVSRVAESVCCKRPLMSERRKKL